MRKGKHTVIIAIALIVTMISGVLAITAFANNPEFTIDYDSRVADPNTSEDHGFSDIPLLHDGRIWTDKSVTVNAGANDFTVTLSALSQSFNVTHGYAIPADTVFIIDVSGSMFMDENMIDGRRRIEVLIDALNETIGMLLDANPYNRIAVVAYGGRSGGYARVENALPLGRPTLARGDSGFFSYRHEGGDNHFVDVHAIGNRGSIRVQGSTPTQWGIYEGTRILSELPPEQTKIEVPVINELGVVEREVEVTRRPNIILMTDGEPTMGWRDYAFADEATRNMLIRGPNGIQLVESGGAFYGDGSFGEMGVSLLTVLTAAHRKREVYNKYFPPNWNNYPASQNQPDSSVGFYTISITNQQTAQARALIDATMNPFGVEQFANNLGPTLAGGLYPYAPNPARPGGESPQPDTMGSLLNTFTTTPISFWAQRRVSYPGYVWQQVVDVRNIEGPGALNSTHLNYATKYFPVSNAAELSGAFAAITESIQSDSIGNITSAPPNRQEFDGYIVFSDVLGEYMEFRGITELRFNDTPYPRAGVGAAIANNTGGVRAEFVNTLHNQLNYGTANTDPRFVPLDTVVRLLESNRTNLIANDSIKYYARTNRDFIAGYFNADGSVAPRPDGAAAIVELFPMWGDLNVPGPPPPGMQHEKDHNLMHIAFHVITSLNNNTSFDEIHDGGIQHRILNAGDQMIRWYIPASLIPQRRVEHIAATAFTLPVGVLDTAGFNTHPIRVRFRVGLNEERVAAGVSWSHFYENRLTRADGENQVFFYTNRNQAVRQNVTLAFYEPHPENPYYSSRELGGSRGVAKTRNVTHTAPHVMVHYHTLSNTARGGTAQSRLDEHWLGNNGRLTVRLANPPLPPGTQPSPPTGTTGNLIIPVIVLASGAIVLTGAEVYRRKQKSKNKK